MSLKPNRLAFALTAALAALPAAVWAQDEAAADEAEKSEAAQLGTITVTARKREETLQEVPIAVTAFSEQKLEDFNVEDLSDLDAQVPNLTVYAARGSSSTITAYIRAVGQSDPLWGVDPGVGIYLDDVYIARPQGALLDVFDVERIEVLRGPQGTLYGKNTIGGAIKYVSRPLDQDFGGRVSVTAGNYNQQDIKAGFNVPLSDTGWVARFAGANLTRDGFGENLRTGQDVSDKEIVAGRFTLGYIGSPDWSLKFTADHIDDASAVRGAQMLGVNRFAPTVLPLDDRYDVRNGMPNVNDTVMDGYSLTLDFKLNDDWSLKSITALRESDTETNIDFDTLANTLADVKAFYSDEQQSQEIQLNYDGGGNFTGVAGLYWFQGEAGGTVLNNFFNLSFGNTNGQVDTDAIAFYGEGTYRFDDQWSLTLGGRWTSEEKTVDIFNQTFRDATFSTPLATVSDLNDSVKFDNFSPKISLDYQATDDVLLYGLASRGFKSGGFNIRANISAVPASGRPFDDESVTTYELGAKVAFADQSWYLNAAYFYSDYKDIQLSIFTTIPNSNPPAFFGDFTNAGAATVQGIELELFGQISDNWVLQGNIGWLDAKYDEYISGGVDVSGVQKFTNAPEFSGALSLQHIYPLASGGEIRSRVGYSYQDKVYPTTDLSEAIAQDGYGLWNASVIWQIDDAWKVALEGSNLADEEYRTTGYNIAALGILTGFYGPPRTVSLTASYEF
ncbi:MAG: TonB-dependent receptor [Rhodanobacteraceae bacterium]|nr:TonB-dependent receptor [Rhodanobacteraceae bacterium]